ncbi:uncharacterized protein [Primulina huaijiensis]|uniref:uncharacterized protein isoform X1 n=2 Tax=Primulina huaijiensis TaxID=1492673 RepID=UPI003CC788C0
MEEESCEVHYEDDKTLPDKSKKRIVKTRSQVEALEKFYDEHKYPSEPMKIQLAESIGLTEKQVSGWFCHRRLKDKRLLNGETCAIGRQDRSSGVIQDRGSGLRQDSCGSTKQGDDRNFDTREVESGRLNVQAADFTHERGRQYTGNNTPVNDSTSGSSSSLPNMPSHHNGEPLDLATSRYLIPKFPVEVKGVKARSGPSGYLKVKGQVENSAITAVKMQLGRHYREDGPPLGVEFDPLPPGAFETPMQNPVDEPCYSGEPIVPASPDVSKIRQYPTFDMSSQDFGYNSGMTSHKSNIDRAKTMYVSHPSDNYFQQKFGQQTMLLSSGTYYPRRNFSVELPENLAKYTPGCDDRDENQMRSRQGVEVVRKGSFPNHRHILPCGVKVEAEPAEAWTHRSNAVKVEGEPAETWTHRSNGVNVEGEPAERWTRKSNDNIAKISHVDVKKEPSYMATKANDYHNITDRGMPQHIIKDGKFYGERRTKKENYEPDQVKIPFKNEMPAPKRSRGEILHQQHQQRSFPVDNQPWTSHRSRAEMPSSFNEDMGSAETSSLV